MKTIEKPKPEEILSALRLLGLSADVIFARILADVDRGLVKEARSHLNFVDELSAPPNAKLSEPRQEGRDVR